MFRFIKKILNTLSYTSVWVALTGVTTIYTTISLLQLPVSLELLLLAFFSVLPVYNLNKIADIKEDSVNYPERVKFLKKYRREIIAFSVISYVTALIIAFFINFLVLLLIILLPTTVFFYSTFPRLKKLLFIKNIWVSFFWAFYVTFLPLFFYKITLSISAIFIFLFIFTKGLGNTIAFDVRDIKGDKMYKIKTIPSKLDIKNTKRLLILINVISFIILVFITFIGVFPKIGYFVSLVTFYTFAYIYFIDKTELKFLTDILADGEFIVMGLLAFLGKVLM